MSLWDLLGIIMFSLWAWSINSNISVGGRRNGWEKSLIPSVVVWEIGKMKPQWIHTSPHARMKRGWITGAWQEAFGSNGALVAGPVHEDMFQQHRVLLHLGFLPHRLPVATSSRDPPAISLPVACTTGSSCQCLTACSTAAMRSDNLIGHDGSNVARWHNGNDGDGWWRWRRWWRATGSRREWWNLSATEFCVVGSRARWGPLQGRFGRA
jgi:hypothetical protein